jgi:hypothetical protein
MIPVEKKNTRKKYVYLDKYETSKVSTDMKIDAIAKKVKYATVLTIINIILIIITLFFIK